MTVPGHSQFPCVAVAGDAETLGLEVVEGAGGGEEAVGVGLVDERDGAWAFAGDCLEALRSGGYEWVWDVLDGAAGNFFRVEERAVEQGVVDRLHDVFDSAVPSIPLIDVGQEEQGLLRPAQDEG